MLNKINTAITEENEFSLNDLSSLEVNKISNAIEDIVPYTLTKAQGVIKGLTAFTFVNEKVTQEDKITIATNIKIKLPNNKGDTFVDIIGIYNGMNSEMIAEKCKESLHRYICSDPEFLIHTSSAILNAFMKLDQEMKDLFQENFYGAYVVMILLVADHCYAINLGVGRIVLSTQEEVYYLNKEHIIPDNNLFRKDPNLNLVSLRCISSIFSSKEYQGLFSCYPDINQIKLTGEMDFIILTSSSISDKLTNSELCDVVYDKISQLDQNKSIKEIYSNIIRTIFTKASNLGAKDNLSCVVVFIKSTIELKRQGACDIKSNGEFYTKSLKYKSFPTIVENKLPIQSNVIINNFNNNYQIKQKTKIYWGCCSKKKKSKITSTKLEKVSFA